MTIERRDSFAQSREKGMPLFDVLLGKRTRTRLFYGDVLWADGMITGRFSDETPDTPFHTGSRVLVIDERTVAFLKSHELTGVLTADKFISGNKINEFASKNRRFPLEYSPGK